MCISLSMYPVQNSTTENGQQQFLTPNYNVESSFIIDRTPHPRLLCILPEIYIIFYSHLFLLINKFICAVMTLIKLLHTSCYFTLFKANAKLKCSKPRTTVWSMRANYEKLGNGHANSSENFRIKF